MAVETNVAKRILFWKTIIKYRSDTVKRMLFECRGCGKITSTTNDKVYGSKICFSCRTDHIVPVDKLMKETIEEI